MSSGSADDDRASFGKSGLPCTFCGQETTWTYRGKPLCRRCCNEIHELSETGTAEYSLRFSPVREWVVRYLVASIRLREAEEMAWATFGFPEGVTPLPELQLVARAQRARLAGMPVPEIAKKNSQIFGPGDDPGQLAFEKPGCLPTWWSGGCPEFRARFSEALRQGAGVTPDELREMGKKNPDSALRITYLALSWLRSQVRAEGDWEM